MKSIYALIAAASIGSCEFVNKQIRHSIDNIVEEIETLKVEYKTRDDIGIRDTRTNKVYKLSRANEKLRLEDTGYYQYPYAVEFFPTKEVKR